MRHRKRAGKLARTSAHRRAMFRNLVTDLLAHERVQTTDVKAKEVRRIAERMITLGKRGHLDARRRALRVVRSREVAGKLFSDLAERYRDRCGGYTRVVKVRHRMGDAAPLSIVELVEGDEPKRKPGKRRKGSASAPPVAPAKPRASRRRTREKAESGSRAEEKQARPSRRLRKKAAKSEKSTPTKKS